MTDGNMATRKFFYPAVATLISLHAIHVHGKYSKKAREFANAFSAVQSSDTKSISRTSHLQCFLECIARKSCKYISSAYRPGFAASDRPYKCNIYMGNETDPAGNRNTCMDQFHPIGDIPQAVAGACADHGCTQSEICKPLFAGGYQCKTERRRKNHLKAPRRKKKKISS